MKVWKDIKIEELAKVGEELLVSYPEQRIFAFYGTLGAGKTTFIKVLCRLLGAAEPATSPTFSLVNIYRTPEQTFIYHIDLYRINKQEEVFDLGYEEYLYSGNYCFIEWPEHIEDLLPPGTVRVMISGDPDRIIQILV